jgi:DNA-binding MarR family transcriptional regulator
VVEVAMNQNFFGLKRAFHGTLRITRAALARIGLTAARFDLLHALPHEVGQYRPQTRQSALRGKLGVSRPTISRMLRSLEELGLVRRTRDSFDGRQLVVTLTPSGEALIRRAERRFIRSGWAQLAIDCALDMASPGKRWSDPMHCLWQMETLEGLLRRIRKAFGDVATLYYPWHPDD